MDPDPERGGDATLRHPGHRHIRPRGGVGPVAQWIVLPPLIVFQRLNSGVSVFALMAIPFFIYAGDLMVRGGIAARSIML